MNSPKNTQRHLLRKRRSTLSRAEVVSLSEKICTSVYKTRDWSSIRSVHVYLPIVKNNEVNTWPLINRLWKAHPQIQISTSVYKLSRSLRHVIISPETDVQEDEHGIPTPISNYSQEELDYDLIIVPVLGFDEILNRLGYGRGVYDTFLAQQPAATKVGLAYELLKLKNIKNEPHDVPLNEVITEKQLYNKSYN